MTKNYNEIDPKSGDITNRTAEEYKLKLARDFGITQNPSEVGGIEQAAAYVASGLGYTKSRAYRELASTVDYIEAGQAGSTFGNWVRGMKAPAVDVSAASRELLEICRQEFAKIDANPALDEDDKNAERQKVFDVLETIRIANAREKTWKWTNEFLTAFGKNMKASMPSMGQALFRVAICVAVFVVASIFLAPAMPYLFAALAVFCFAKLVSNAWGAWKEADAAASKEKKAAAKEVLEMAAGGANQILEETREATEQATEAVEKEIEVLKADLDTKTKAYNDNEDLIKQQASLEEKRELMNEVLLWRSNCSLSLLTPEKTKVCREVSDKCKKHYKLTSNPDLETIQRYINEVEKPEIQAALRGLPARKDQAGLKAAMTTADTALKAKQAEQKGLQAKLKTRESAAENG